MKKLLQKISLLLALLFLFSLPALAFDPIGSGSRGDAVSAVQKRLNELGYEAGSVDGSYGGRTRDAVAKFQQNNGLEATGVVDEETYELLFSLAAQANNASGAADPDVARLQRLLSLLGYEVGEVNGSFNKATVAALTAYQEANGLRTGGQDIAPALRKLEAEVAALCEGLLLVNNGDAEALRWGYADPAGSIVIEPQFAWASGTWGEGLAAVIYETGKCGYIDPTGAAAFSTGYAAGGPFSEGVALVSKEEHRGYIDMKGGFIVPLSENKTDARMYTVFSEGRARAGDKLVDKYGNSLTLPLSFQDVGSMMVSGFVEAFHEGLMCLRTVTDAGRKCGYVDASGQTAIAFSYDDAGSFSEGLAVAAQAEDGGALRYGYIDNTGAFIVRPLYDQAGTFREGVGVVRSAKNGWGFVDEKGAFTAAAADWDSVVGDGFHEGLLAVMKDGEIGFVDTAGELRIPFGFADPSACTPSGDRALESDRLYAFKGGVCLVIGADQELFYIDAAGETLFSAGIY